MKFAFDQCVSPRAGRLLRICCARALFSSLGAARQSVLFDVRSSKLKQNSCCDSSILRHSRAIIVNSLVERIYEKLNYFRQIFKRHGTNFAQNAQQNTGSKGVYQYTDVCFQYHHAQLLHVIVFYLRSNHRSLAPRLSM